MTKQTTYDAAKLAGLIAAESGADLADNPYSFKHQRDAWDGWKDGNLQHWLWQKGAA